MSAAKLAIISLAIAYVEARFGQEGLASAAVQALSNFGAPGAAGTLSGQVPGVLLAAANPCAKLQLADDIVTQLGDDQQVLDAAIGVVAAEQNFNPFAVDTGNICADASLPATEALRGILPLFDPAVDGSDIENANSAQSVQTPFDATGISVAELAIAQGFTNFFAVDAAGNQVDLAGLTTGANAGAGNGAAAGDAANNNDAAAGNAAADDAAADDAATVGNNDACAGVVTDNGEAADDAAADDGAAADNGAVDFGTCDPTIFFAGGLGGRPDTEFTFQSNEPTIAANQQEALNPDIIVNRICDDLNNICGANDAAISACRDAQQLLKDQGLGVGDGDAVVTAFNDAILAA
ncbi:Uncharacterized protein SAPIO_CDS7651 [Scedosporium apiospermum]|uniref:Circumsporozoite protein n=1 Tax=Pseudallescheria apiosperma TaxID=563466 RepID=A0A084G2D4_PSEDA|nr:Uncharacterized protein SAPIO_CDS7651 [Scedosporium apiospermum]KEZ41496.1 Uncharacterized protein SAPIO_CDS7651 [Scedosporium apiospermum]